MPDGHTRPDVEGALIRSKLKKKRTFFFFCGPKKFGKRTALIRSNTVSRIGTAICITFVKLTVVVVVVRKMVGYLQNDTHNNKHSKSPITTRHQIILFTHKVEKNAAPQYSDTVDK